MLNCLKTRVAMQRIETFLNEDEVDEQVSTIKRSKMGPTAPSFDEFGLRDASFKWNAVEEKEKEKKDDKKDAPPPPPHGDKTPWQVFTETLRSEFKASKEWNESTKQLASCINDFTSKSLSTSETGCVSRCVQKHMALQQRLGERFQEHNALVGQQQQR